MQLFEMKKYKIAIDDCDDCGSKGVPVVYEYLGHDAGYFASCKSCDHHGFQLARDATTESWLTGGDPLDYLSP
ncbi:hypothetical protein EBZ70_10980 [bacterium]|nr:hypothetical protein [bacterium]